MSASPGQCPRARRERRETHAWATTRRNRRRTRLNPSEVADYDALKRRLRQETTRSVHEDVDPELLERALGSKCGRTTWKDCVRIERETAKQRGYRPTVGVRDSQLNDPRQLRRTRETALRRVFRVARSKIVSKSAENERQAKTGAGG